MSLTTKLTTEANEKMEALRLKAGEAQKLQADLQQTIDTLDLQHTAYSNEAEQLKDQLKGSKSCKWKKVNLKKQLIEDVAVAEAAVKELDRGLATLATSKEVWSSSKKKQTEMEDALHQKYMEVQAELSGIEEELGPLEKRIVGISHKLPADDGKAIIATINKLKVAHQRISSSSLKSDCKDIRKEMKSIEEELGRLRESQEASEQEAKQATKEKYAEMAADLKKLKTSASSKLQKLKKKTKGLKTQLGKLVSNNKKAQGTQEEFKKTEEMESKKLKDATDGLTVAEKAAEELRAKLKANNKEKKDAAAEAKKAKKE